MCFFSIFPGHLLLNTKKKKKKIYLPTYPIFFGTVTGNKKFFFLGLMIIKVMKMRLGMVVKKSNEDHNDDDENIRIE